MKTRNVLLRILIIYLSSVLAACAQSEKVARENLVSQQTSKTYYMEQHRPQFHFSPDSMWMNDPNGMVYYQGEYHLFYQYYPDSTVWGPMHWGHAASQDLMHWEHLPIALYTDSLGYIFSGSAVVDWENSTGFGTKNNPPLVAVYTYHNEASKKSGNLNFQTQGIAYSLDKGRTWIKYQDNPVVPNPGIKDFRVPKVHWHEKSRQWVMIFAAFDHVKIYNSPNLKQWQLVSEFGRDEGSHGGVWECPDLFPLTLPETGEEKWVMIVSLGNGAPNCGSGTQYFIGDFDGKVFTSDNPKEKVLWLEYGRDNYAGVTWSDIPDEDGRRLFIGWMSNWRYAQQVPTKKWRSAMTIPRKLTLNSTHLGLRIITEPVTELQLLTNNAVRIKEQILNRDKVVELPISGSTFALKLEFIPRDEQVELTIKLYNERNQEVLIGYNADKDQFYLDRTRSGKIDFSAGFSGKHLTPRLSDSDTVKLSLLIDVSSVELFADDGQTVMTDIFFPDEDFSQVQLLTKGGSVELLAGEIMDIASIWSQQ